MMIFLQQYLANFCINKIQNVIYDKDSQCGHKGNRAFILKGMYDKSELLSRSAVESWKKFLWEQEQDKHAYSQHFYSTQY